MASSPSKRGLHMLSTLTAPVVTKDVLREAVTRSGSDYVIDLSRMGVERVRALDNLPLLRSLNLSFNDITEIEGLEPLTDLRELKLYGNKIGRLRGLGANKKIEKLMLQDNQVEIVEGLGDAKFCTLMRLDGNRIRELGGGLDKCLSLADLDLSRNALTTVKGLRVKALRTLRLSHNSISGGVADLALGCPNIQELWLDHNLLESARGLGSLADSLMILQLEHNRLSTWATFARMPALTELFLAGNAFTDIEPLPALFPSLEVLDLRDNRIMSRQARLGGLGSPTAASSSGASSAWSAAEADFRASLAPLTKMAWLVELGIGGNPVCEGLDDATRTRAVRALAPSVTCIDDVEVAPPPTTAGGIGASCDDDDDAALGISRDDGDSAVAAAASPLRPGSAAATRPRTAARPATSSGIRPGTASRPGSAAGNGGSRRPDLAPGVTPNLMVPGGGRPPSASLRGAAPPAPPTPGYRPNSAATRAVPRAGAASVAAVREPPVAQAAMAAAPPGDPLPGDLQVLASPEELQRQVDAARTLLATAKRDMYMRIAAVAPQAELPSSRAAAPSRVTLRLQSDSLDKREEPSHSIPRRDLPPSRPPISDAPAALSVDAARSQGKGLTRVTLRMGDGAGDGSSARPFLRGSGGAAASPAASSSSRGTALSTPAASDVVGAQPPMRGLREALRFARSHAGSLAAAEAEVVGVEGGSGGEARDRVRMTTVSLGPAENPAAPAFRRSVATSGGSAGAGYGGPPEGGRDDRGHGIRGISTVGLWAPASSATGSSSGAAAGPSTAARGFKITFPSSVRPATATAALSTRQSGAELPEPAGASVATVEGRDGSVAAWGTDEEEKDQSDRPPVSAAWAPVIDAAGLQTLSSTLQASRGAQRPSSSQGSSVLRRGVSAAPVVSLETAVVSTLMLVDGGRLDHGTVRAITSNEGGAIPASARTAQSHGASDTGRDSRAGGRDARAVGGIDDGGLNALLRSIS